MIVLKGDEVQLKSGQSGIIIDTWGIARDWIKVETGDGQIVICMTSKVESIIKRGQIKGKGAKKT